MRITIFTLRGPTNMGVVGGARLYIEKFSKILVKQGHEVTILCGNEKKYDLPFNESLGNSIKIIRIPIPFLMFSLHSFYRKKLMNQTDILIENMVSYPLLTPILKNHKATIVHHLPGLEYLRSQGIIKGSVGLFLEYIIMPIMYRNSRIITVSNHSKIDLIHRGFNSTDIQIIPPIVDTSYYHSNKTISERKNQVCYVGRYDGPKGVKRVDDIIDAFRLLRTDDSSLALILAGSMKRVDMLKQKVKQLGLDSCVVFKGFISNKEKKEILTDSKIFISPSYQEGFGITYIEANAAGLPVIGYRIKDLDTVPDYAGIFVERDNVKALYQAIKSLLVSEQSLKKYSLGALRNSERFNPEKIELLINKLVNNK